MFNRQTTFFTALLETLIAVIAGLGALLLPLSILWLVENDPNTDWMVAFRTAADLWLLAHGVHLVMPGATIFAVEFNTFAITILPIGYSVLVYFFAYRLGRKLAATSSLWPGWLAAAAVYFPAGFGVTALAHSEVIYPVEWQGTFIPAVGFAAVLILSSLFAKPADLKLDHSYVEAPERVKARDWVNERFDRLGWVLRVVAVPALRAGTAVIAVLIGFSAFCISILLAFNWISVIRLYEGMQLSFLGVLLVTVAQLALLPNFVIMGAAWFTGAGFSIGAGSMISPLATQVGPMPALPIFAVIPIGDFSFGLVAIAVPLIAAFVATIGVRKYADELRFEFASAFSAAASLGIAIGIVSAIEMLVLSFLASGSVGPERLREFGVNPWMAALAIFIEASLTATLAAFISARPEGVDPEILNRQVR
ncbi:MAG: DUF6350 family protein [Micrococcales bacterium]